MSKKTLTQTTIRFANIKLRLLAKPEMKDRAPLIKPRRHICDQCGIQVFKQSLGRLGGGNSDILSGGKSGERFHPSVMEETFPLLLSLCFVLVSL